MAKVTGQVFGQDTAKVVEVDTVQELYEALGLTENHTATINGEPADMDQELEDFDFVTFTQNVKGGQI